MRSFTQFLQNPKIAFRIKLVIALFSFGFLFFKLPQWFRAEFFAHFKANGESLTLVALVLLLCGINWLLEAKKWQILLSPLQHISILKSIQSVIGGVTIGIMTPNRLGELPARTLFLSKTNKVKATLLGFFGGIPQWLITMLAGLVGLLLCSIENVSILNIVEIAAIIGLVVFLYFKTHVLSHIAYKKFRKPKFRSITKAFLHFTNVQLIQLFLFSVLRYIVFHLQFYLLLKALNVPISIEYTFKGLSLIYLISNHIPGFAFLEAGIRGSVGYWVFSQLGFTAVEPIVSALVFLWIVNVGLVAIVGIPLVARANFKEEKI